MCEVMFEVSLFVGVFTVVESVFDKYDISHDNRIRFGSALIIIAFVLYITACR